jgi:hypothetical protein
MRAQRRSPLRGSWPAGLAFASGERSHLLASAGEPPSLVSSSIAAVRLAVLPGVAPAPCCSLDVNTNAPLRACARDVPSPLKYRLAST